MLRPTCSQVVPAIGRHGPRDSETLSRRDMLRLAAGMSAGVLVAPPADAFFFGLLRLLFGMGIRGGLARGATAGLLRGAATRGAVSSVGRAALRGGGVSLGATSARASAAAGGTRLATAMRPARRVGAGAAATATSASSGASMIDLGLLAWDANDLLGSEPWPEAVSVEEVDLLEIEIDGQNTTSWHVNGVLSILVFDEAFASGGEGRFFRHVLGVVAPAPGARMQFVHAFDLSGWGEGRLLIAPTLTNLARDETDRAVEFFPPVQLLDLKGA